MATIKSFDCWKPVTYDITDLVAIRKVEGGKLYAYKHRIVAEAENEPNVFLPLWEDNEKELVTVSADVNLDSIEGLGFGLIKDSSNKYYLLVSTNEGFSYIELINTDYPISAVINFTTTFIIYLDNLSTLHIHAYYLKNSSADSSSVFTHEITIPMVIKYSDCVALIKSLFSGAALMVMVNNEVNLGYWIPIFSEESDGSVIYDEENSVLAIEPLSNHAWEQEDLKTTFIHSASSDSQEILSRMAFNEKTHQMSCSDFLSANGDYFLIGDTLNIKDNNTDMIGYEKSYLYGKDETSVLYSVVAFVDKLNKKEYYTSYQTNASPLYVTKPDGELIGDINFSITSSTINLSIENFHLKVNSIDFGLVSEKYTHYTVNGIPYKFNQEYTINSIHDYPVILQKAATKPVRIFNSLGDFLGLAKTINIDA